MDIRADDLFRKVYLELEPCWISWRSATYLNWFQSEKKKKKSVKSNTLVISDIVKHDLCLTYPPCKTSRENISRFFHLFAYYLFIYALIHDLLWWE